MMVVKPRRTKVHPFRNAQRRVTGASNTKSAAIDAINVALVPVVLQIFLEWRTKMRKRNAPSSRSAVQARTSNDF